MYSKTNKLLLFGATLFLFATKLKLAAGLNCWVCDEYDEVVNQCSPKITGSSKPCLGPNAVCELIEEKYPEYSPLHGITYNLRKCGHKVNLPENTSTCDPFEKVVDVTVTRCYCNSEDDCNKEKIGEVGNLPIKEEEPINYTTPTTDWGENSTSIFGNDPFFKDVDIFRETKNPSSISPQNWTYISYPQLVRLPPSNFSRTSTNLTPSQKNNPIQNVQQDFNPEAIRKILTNYAQSNPQNSSRLRCIQCDNYDEVNFQCNPENKNGNSVECPDENSMCELVQEYYDDISLGYNLYGKKFYRRKCTEGTHLVGKSGTCDPPIRIAGVKITRCYCNDYDDCNVREINGVGEEQPYYIGYGKRLERSTLKTIYNMLNHIVKTDVTTYFLPNSCEKLVNTGKKERGLGNIILACFRRLQPFSYFKS